jgi:hypothetical protein
MMEGYKETDHFASRPMVLKGCDVVIDRARIPEYLNNENGAKLAFYSRYKAFGWPFAGGWAEQPAYLLDIIERLEIEARKK